MTHPLHTLEEGKLLQAFSDLVRRDRSTTANLLRYIAEIDRRELYLKHACSSMFAFCVERFHMSEAIAYKRIRGGRVASRFPRIFGMLERGELHLGGLHQLGSHLTEENHEEVLSQAKHKTVRQIEKLVAEVAPKPDVPSKIVTLPTRKPTKQTQGELPSGRRAQSRPEVTPLSPRRYKLQVTMAQETRDKLTEAQELLSHQIPNGDEAEILDKALDALLEKARKQKAALTNKPRKGTKRQASATRAVPAAVKREVFWRDEGRCAFVDDHGNHCRSRRFVEYHHKVPFALGGKHDSDNIELRCHVHNQYQANRDYGAEFMKRRRNAGRRPGPS